jgi:hypothetical protein
MNTYDPADRVRYVHMTRGMESSSTPQGRGCACTRLPVGYANRFVRTCLSPLGPG